MHFDMHVCLLEKFCYAASTAKIFANFAPVLGLKNGPKNGARI